MWRMVSLIALAACASYRALPLETAAPGPSPLTLRYEQGLTFEEIGTV